MNPHKGVYACFDNSLSGYFSADDASLVIENLYKNKDIKILSVDVSDSNIVLIRRDDKERLSPGGKISLIIDGNLLDDFSRLCIRVMYSDFSKLRTVKERSFVFTFIGKTLNDDRKFVENEFFDRKKSGISDRGCLRYRLAYSFSFISVIKTFSKSEAYRYIL